MLPEGLATMDDDEIVVTAVNTARVKIVRSPVSIANTRHFFCRSLRKRYAQSCLDARVVRDTRFPMSAGRRDMYTSRR